MSRRRLCAAAAALALPHPAFARGQPVCASEGLREIPNARMDWARFRSRFITDEGRVVDTDNGCVSHSEGQAWAMLLAVIENDRSAFERIHAWTRRTLGIRGDRLLAWRYRPAPHGRVDDLNSATDGDLFHAWALLRAAERWDAPEYHALARGVATDILHFAARQVDGRTLLLPGARGFDHATHFVLNPSYYAFPALDALAAAFPHPAWHGLITEGERMLSEARYGRWQLPTDWVTLDRRGGTLLPEPVRGLRFGFDAMRIPLYLAWSGRWQASAMASSTAFWADPRHPYIPAWVQITNDQIAPYPTSIGGIAIHHLAGRIRSPRALPSRIILPPTHEGYYSSVLSLLAAAARREAPPLPPMYRS